MSKKVTDFVEIKRLERIKDLGKLEEGQGYRILQDNLLTVLFHNGEPMSFLGFLEFNNVKLRGDHYHKNKIENMCIITGSLKAKYVLPEKPNDVYEVELKAGDVVTVLPGCVHTYISDSSALAVEFSPQLFDKDDLIKYKID